MKISISIDTLDQESVDKAILISNYIGALQKGQPTKSQVETASAEIPPPPTEDASTVASDSTVIPPPPSEETVDSDAPSEDEISTEVGDLDINGLPWDGRIHSSGKTKDADGSWRNKRGVNPDERARIEAELKGGVPASSEPEKETETSPEPVAEKKINFMMLTKRIMALKNKKVWEAHEEEFIEGLEIEKYLDLGKRQDLWETADFMLESIEALYADA